MDTLTIRAEYPCCKGRAFFTVIEGVPRQQHDRRCQFCGKRWSVLREQIPKSNPNIRRLDRLIWTPV